MAIIDERGLFWWHEELVPDRHFAPENSVAGHLKIEADGRISLELDSFLPNEKGPLSTLMSAEQAEIEKRSIQGILKDSGNRVLLLNLIKAGGRFSTNAMSFEKYSAMNCLVSTVGFANNEAVLKFKGLEVDLTGFQEWLRLGSIEIKRSSTRTSTTYRKPKNVVYRLEDGELIVRYGLSGPSPFARKSDEVSLKESVSFVYQSTRRATLEELKEQYALLEDLLILLTGSDYCLEWPFVKLSKDRRCRWYFRRVRSRETTSPPTLHECWTNFLQLRDGFGVIWSNWKRKRKQFGAGFYLYLGTRRGMNLYTEHRFVNLVWGIEAFHRKRHPASESSALTIKVLRIVDQIAASKDKRWLARKLAYASEPALEERIVGAFKSLPIDIAPERLHKFAVACADRRNEVSHYGGPKEGDYAEFVRELDRRSDALSTLYHTLLLSEVGVDPKILRWYIYKGSRSHSIRMNFIEVGLLEKSESSGGG
jgi:hypothetical protein